MDFVAVRESKWCVSVAFLASFISSLSSAIALLRTSLSLGCRLQCHTLRSLLFSLILARISKGRQFWLDVFAGISGVVDQHATWIRFVKRVAASSISSGVLRAICSCSLLSITSLKESQSVYLLYNLGTDSYSRMVVPIVSSTGV